jgi:hypothetical protein
MFTKLASPAWLVVGQLPKGLIGKLAGIEQCSDAALAAAAAKTGTEELADPSCPASSRIGHTDVGAGVGSVLTWVDGEVYLAGPYLDAPLSVAAITPAVAGPFDVGVVVTRLGLTVDPETAEVSVDPDSSDPIPHILRGIPLKIREIRVKMDREQFILNPTSCDELQIGADVSGSGLDVFDPADDVLREVSTRFQAANCALLGFRPNLSFKATGPEAHKRSGHPRLHSTLIPGGGDANIESAQITLPRGTFLDQDNLETICTRPQFAAESCPANTQVGTATAQTPLLDDPLTGPVWLIASDNPLPDIVADLHGLVDFHLFGRISSTQVRLRTDFDLVPDAPVSRFDLTLFGGKRGLLVNSRNTCKRNRLRKIDARFVAQNSKVREWRPKIEVAACERKAARKLEGKAKRLNKRARKAARKGKRNRASLLRKRAGRAERKAARIRARA